MNWIAFCILAYVAVGLQTGLGAFVRLGASEPNFGLVAVIFISINAPRQPALLASFMLGAMQDLATEQSFGLFALSYGLVAMAVTWISQAVYREHPLTHFFCALLGGGVTGMMILLHGRIHHMPVGRVMTLSNALYTAVLAVFLIGVLQRVRAVFVFRR